MYSLLSGGTRTESSIELLFARQNFIMHVKGYGLQAIDMVYINFKGSAWFDNKLYCCTLLCI